MSKITITRSDSWINILEINNIYIDGAKVGLMSVGETIHFDVAPGKHTVKAKGRFLGGNSRLIEVEVGKDENKTIKLSPVKYMLLAYSFFIVLALITSILITRFSNVDIRRGPEIMFGILTLYLLYYFTFGRNRSWKMEEVGSMKVEEKL